MLLAKFNELKALMDSVNEFRNSCGFGSIVFDAHPYGENEWSVYLYPQKYQIFFSIEVSRIMTYCNNANISVVISTHDGAPSIYLQ